MSTLSIRIPGETKTAIKLLAVARGQSLEELICGLIERELGSEGGLTVARDAANATLRKLRNG